jgi:small subunit ribosomal protein S6e
MPFKINVSLKGKTKKYETESEYFLDRAIGENIPGKEVAEELDGYELKITGTSDKAGFPGLEEHKGPSLKRVLLKKGKAMKDKRKGLRLKKTIRGNTISLDTIQINTIVEKQGPKKFEEIFKKEEPKVEGAEAAAEKPAEESKPEEKTKEVKEEKKEESKSEDGKK